MGAELESPAERQRIDRFLWFARLTKTRSAAQALCAAGHIRLNGRRVERAHAPVRPGDVLTLPTPVGARAVRVAALPKRRGPASEAATLVDAIDEGEARA